MTLGGKNPSVFIAGINALTPETPGSSQNFVNRLIAEGFVVTSNPDSAEYFVCVDHSSSDLRSARRAGITRECSVLIRNEPTVVSPQNRDSVVGKEYALILDMGRPISRSNNSLPWPQQWPSVVSERVDASHRKNRVVLINANKISFLPGELYSLRRASLLKFDSIDLFGQGWNMSFGQKLKHYLSNLWIALKSGQRPRFSGGKYFFRKTSNWKGAPADKREVAKLYKYALVIENSKEFITEKIFDALFSGCIPIYVGPNLEEFDIPNNLYVKAEDNIESISQQIKSLHEMDYDNWHKECTKWLSRQDVFSTWKSENVNKKIFNRIKHFVQEAQSGYPD
jgi:hypothetical protein